MDKKIIINEGVKPLWQRVIAGLLYTVAVYFIYLFFTNKPIGFTEEYIKSFIYLFEYIIIVVVAALPFSLTKNHYFDFENKKYKLEYAIGYLKYGKWKNLPQLKYVSVFKNQRDNFEVNLWYYKNEHFNIFEYFDSDIAMDTGFQIAEKLQIKLLDATSHHNYKWIDKKKYKDSKK